MPEDRLVDALFDDARVRRLIVAEPYRNVAAYARDVVKRQSGAAFPAMFLHVVAAEHTQRAGRAQGFRACSKCRNKAVRFVGG